VEGECRMAREEGEERMGWMIETTAIGIRVEDIDYPLTTSV